MKKIYQKVKQIRKQDLKSKKLKNDKFKKEINNFSTKKIFK